MLIYGLLTDMLLLLYTYILLCTYRPISRKPLYYRKAKDVFAIEKTFLYDQIVWPPESTDFKMSHSVSSRSQFIKNKQKEASLLDIVYSWCSGKRKLNIRHYIVPRYFDVSNISLKNPISFERNKPSITDSEFH